VRNIFTVDLEDWFHANFPGVVGPTDRRPTPYLRRQLTKLLQLLSDAGVHGTFFVLGEVAEADPWFVTAVAEAGHEVASHGFDHSMVSLMTEQQFAEDVRRALSALHRAGIPRVRGYRAPSWSLDRSRTDLFGVLADLGFEYDASVFPIRNFLYGDRSAPRLPFTAAAGIHEFPSSAVSVGGFRLSVFGGFYLRASPYTAIAWGIRRLNAEGLPAIVYVHPREIDPTHPRLPLKPRDRFIHYFNTRRTEAKIRRLLREFEFGTFDSLLC
jgi:polysaccharide deacetylase family protein (PEP-CTERM system associated)